MLNELPASIVKLSLPVSSWLPFIVRTPPPLIVWAPVIVTSLYDSRSIVPAPTLKLTLSSVRSLPEEIELFVALVTWIVPPPPVLSEPANVTLPRPLPAGVFTVMLIALAVPLVVVSEAPLLIVKSPPPEPSLLTSMSIRPLPALTAPLRATESSASTVKLAFVVTAANVMSFVSSMDASFALVIVTLPPKSFDPSVSVMVPVSAASVVAPVTETAPL